MDPDKTDQSTYHIVLRLSRIADVRQRSYALAERLNELEVEAAVDVIKEIRQKAMDGHEDCLRLFNGLMLVGTLAEVLGQEKLSAIVDRAQGRGEYEVAALFIDLPSQDRGDRPHQPFLDGTLKETPLGMRKFLARRPDFKLIERIARDQDYRVIEQLLDNPRLTEKDVIHIGSTRPTAAKVLEAIYNHSKWVSRYRVKKTIVFNPHTPPSLALRLLSYLSIQDLELLRDLSEVDRVVLNEAEKVLEKRTQGMDMVYWLE
ncbi:MAG: hypothetical protein FJY85_07135 [Deltaproteobacteria bacterium]|nr:hypothetical protein [Deltaproteobacteria bacterium]